MVGSSACNLMSSDSPRLRQKVTLNIWILIFFTLFQTQCYAWTYCPSDSGCSFYAKGHWCTCAKLPKSSLKVDMSSSQCYFACNVHFLSCPFDTELAMINSKTTSLLSSGGPRHWWGVCTDDSSASEHSEHLELVVLQKSLACSNVLKPWLWLCFSMEKRLCSYRSLH